jgi:hypothetical protein
MPPPPPAEAEGVEMDVGIGSLGTLAIGGATGADAGCGAGAVMDRVETARAVAAAVETAPVSSEKNLSEIGFPEKNSPAVSEGSIDGAGGKMSDWNESDYFVLGVASVCVCGSA